MLFAERNDTIFIINSVKQIFFSSVERPQYILCKNSTNQMSYIRWTEPVWCVCVGIKYHEKLQQ